MKRVDLVLMAKGNLWRRKLRTALTVLGIVIGTVSILLMVAVGLGIKDTVTKEFAGLGSTNIIQVYKGDSQNRQARFSEEKGYEKLQELDVDFINGIEGVTTVVPTVQTMAKLVSGKYETTVPIVGIDVSQMEELGYKIAKGSLPGTSGYDMFFGMRAIESFKTVGENFQTNRRVQDDFEEVDDAISFDDDGLFDKVDMNKFDVDVFTDRIRLSMDESYSVQQGNTLTKAKVYPISGVGILKDGDMSRDDNVYMSIDAVKKISKEYLDIYNIKSKPGYDVLLVKVEDIKKIKGIKKILEKKGYSTFSMSSFLDSINSTLMTLQLALGAIGGISLMVAAIGITNTMVMAITERKKEIGVMKVIGATIKDIKNLFLLEAAMIGLIGGAIGIGISVSIANFISSPAFAKMLNGGSTLFAFQIPLWLIGYGLVFTTLVGILSGYLPARKAMKSSALEAIRNE